MGLRYVVGKRKVAIIGAGFVGSSIAYALALKDIACEIVLIDTIQDKIKGEAWDIRHGLASMGTVDLYAGDYSDCKDCDLIIITAGRNRKPGESRLDMVSENTKILHSVIQAVKKYYTRGVILLISNPVDILTQKASEWMELPNGYVMGTGCLLDTSRFVRTIADYIRLSTGAVHGYMVGEHGDHQVPVWSRVTVGGIPIDEYCHEAKIIWNEEIRADIMQKTIKMGGDIIGAKGRTHYGIATCTCYLAEAILNQRPIIASVSSPLMGEYGVNGVSLSVPSVVGSSGVQMRIHEKWEEEEYRGFCNAVDKMKEVLSQL